LWNATYYSEKIEEAAIMPTIVSIAPGNPEPSPGNNPSYEIWTNTWRNARFQARASEWEK
jgi:hypothetical protein